MSQYLETLDQREHLGKHWLASMMFHGGVVILLVFSGFKSDKPNNWGSPNPGGGAVGVSVVKSIPLPSRAGLVTADDACCFRSGARQCHGEAGGREEARLCGSP